MPGRKVAVPYNIVESSNAIMGLDAHYWSLLDERYRIAFLAKPVNMLARTIDRDAMPLPVRVEVSDQLREVSRVARELSRKIDEDRRELRSAAALSTILYPIPVRVRDQSLGERYVAYYILSKLLEGARPVGTRMWLHLKISASRSGLDAGDKSYNWLISREARLKSELEMTLKKWKTL